MTILIMATLIKAFLGTPEESLPKCSAATHRWCPERAKLWSLPIDMAIRYTGTKVKRSQLQALAAIETIHDPEVYARKKDPTEYQRGLYSIMCKDGDKETWGSQKWLHVLRKADPMLHGLKCSDIDSSSTWSVFLQTVSAIKVLEYMSPDLEHAATVVYAGNKKSKNQEMRKVMFKRFTRYFDEVPEL